MKMCCSPFNKRLLITCLILVACSACSSYTPHVAPVVFLEKKNDFQVDGGFNHSYENLLFPGLHYSVAYAVSNNMYLQYYWNTFDWMSYLRTNQISAGYKFELAPNIYANAAIGFTHQQIERINISLFTNKKRLNYHGNFKIPYYKLNLTYNDKKQLVSLGLKTGLIFPEINNFDEKALLLQPSFSIIPMSTNRRYNFSIICGRSFMIPINDHKLKINKHYKFDDKAYFISLNNTVRFNMNGRFRKKRDRNN